MEVKKRQTLPVDNLGSPEDGQLREYPVDPYNHDRHRHHPLPEVLAVHDRVHDLHVSLERDHHQASNGPHLTHRRSRIDVEEAAVDETPDAFEKER